ncbi:MAG TPA: hypothetical protein VJ792_03200 [Candidatus Nitrosotalea sp.]|nr:hypothetical protein [Candidatus Nitrosotalea sp.]
MLKLLVVLAASLAIFSTASAFGQISMGGVPQEDIKVTIDADGTAHVEHLVNGNATNAVHVEMISGNMTNLSVSDLSGQSVQYSTISQNPMTIMLLPTQRNMTVIKYDLPNIVINKNGVWQWDYYTPSDAQFTDFYFPKGVDTIWLLSDAKDTARPVYLAEKGIRQMGNGMHLAYMINESETVQTVQWQGQTFNVGIETLANVGPPAFDQSAKAYGFDINGSNSLVTILMPRALLWGPYESTINQKPVLASEYNDNATYAWIGLMSNQSGTLQISGTTAIPEFPMFVPLAVAISAVVALRFVTRLSFH